MVNSTVSKSVFQKLTVSSPRGLIAEQLREAILHGALREGQRIVERSLADQLGASLTAVRDALIELEMEGFITKKPSSNVAPRAGRVD